MLTCANMQKKKRHTNKIPALWNAKFKLYDGISSESDIQVFFEYIIKNMTE